MKSGDHFQEFVLPVERGKIREFSRAIHSSNPLYRDEAVARTAGFPDVIAPPTFSATELHWIPYSLVDALGIDLKRLLAGGCEWEYRRPLVAGEELRVESSIIDVTEKDGKSGTMTFIVRESRFIDKSGAVAQIARSTMIVMPEREAVR